MDGIEGDAGVNEKTGIAVIANHAQPASLMVALLVRKVDLAGVTDDQKVRVCVGLQALLSFSSDTVNQAVYVRGWVVQGAAVGDVLSAGVR